MYPISAGRSGIDQWNFVNKPDDGKSRDPNGSYVRKWVPELARLPNKYLCKPFIAPEQVLIDAGVILGTTYPLPIVTDLNEARKITTEFTIECRRQFQDCNDDQGYDYIELPDFTRTKVFTKKEFRIDKQGNRLYCWNGQDASGEDTGRGKTIGARSNTSARNSKGKSSSNGKSDGLNSHSNRKKARK